MTLTLVDPASSISIVVPLPTSTPVTNNGNGNGNTTISTGDVVPGGKSSSVNIAYAAIAPGSFVVLVLVAVFVRRQRRLRVREAEGNLRSEGVLPEDDRGEGGLGMGGVPIIAVPTPPSRSRRSRTNPLGREDGKTMELHPLPPSSSTSTNPNPPRRDGVRELREGERELRDSDIYSPRYGTPSNHTSASSTTKTQNQNHIQRVGILPSVPSIELEDLDGHSQSPQTPPPMLPPLPSPDLGGNWLGSGMNSPAEMLSRNAASMKSASPPKTPPESSANTLQSSPPIRGPAIQSTSSNSLIATPFHKNYKRTSNAPT